MDIEIPTDDEVVAKLSELAAMEEYNGYVSARALCDALVTDGNPVGRSQLAIQRAAERGKLLINDDWTLSPLENHDLQAA